MSATVRTIIGMYAEIERRNKIDNLFLQKIDIDMAFEELSASRALTDMERQVLSVASTGCSRNSGAKQLGIYRRRYVKLFNSGCAKIAEFLGEEYSDKRIADLVEIRLGRKLTEEERKKVLLTLSAFSDNYSKESVL